jgi:hypothetical protein
MKLSLLLFAGFLFTTSAAGEGRLALKNLRDSTGGEGKATTTAQPLVGEGRRTLETNQRDSSSIAKARRERPNHWLAKTGALLCIFAPF